MDFVNFDFVTNSSSSCYLAIYKNKKVKNENKFLMKALGIKSGTVLENFVKMFQEEKEDFKDVYRNEIANGTLNIKLSIDYGDDRAKYIINEYDKGTQMYVIKVHNDGYEPDIQCFIMMNDLSVENRSIVMFRRDYGY